MNRPVIVPFFIAHEGCPHRCLFCNQWKISGAIDPLPSSDEILERVAGYLETSRCDAVEAAFYGGTFTSLPLGMQERLLRPLQPLLEKGTVSGVRVSTRPDAVDDEVAAFLRGRGVTVVELGVQSLDDDVLLRSQRGHGAKEVHEAVSVLRRWDFRVGLQLMTGLPGDTPDKSVVSLKQALALSPDFLRIYPALVIAGTELEKQYRRGEYVPMSLEEAVMLCSGMLRLAENAKVPVIRVGLQATEELQPGASLVAGPFHPAFRQLVHSRLCYEDVAVLAAGMSGPIAVRCAPGRISDVVGQRRANIEEFARQGLRVVAVHEDERLAPMELRVEEAVVPDRQSGLHH